MVFVPQTCGACSKWDVIDKACSLPSGSAWQAWLPAGVAATCGAALRSGWPSSMPHAMTASAAQCPGIITVMIVQGYDCNYSHGVVAYMVVFVEPVQSHPMDISDTAVQSTGLVMLYPWCYRSIAWPVMSSA